MILKNLTVQPITLMGENRVVLARIQPEKKAAFCAIDMIIKDHINDIPVVNYEYYNVTNLPKPKDGVVYIVNYAVLQALNGLRSDVVAPDTSPGSVVRDEQTRKVIGIKRFQKL